MMILRVSVNMVHCQRHDTRGRMNLAPTTFFTFPTGPLNEPPADVIGNYPFASTSLGFSVQPPLNVISILKLHLAAERTVFRPQVLDYCPTSWARQARLFSRAHGESSISPPVEWGYLDSNQGPQLYQSCALAN